MFGQDFHIFLSDPMMAFMSDSLHPKLRDIHQPRGMNRLSHNLEWTILTDWNQFCFVLSSWFSIH